MPETALTAAHRLVSALREEFTLHGISAPGLQVDMAAVLSGVPGVQLGGVDGDAAQHLLDALRHSAPPAPTTPCPAA
ncbi:hypothetical protein GCM10009759_55000 [Kitasatospora saccharophila]|uniref:Uncharacterized protein n=1 Tax=Kitasatospora saccharophila TaxID=407973 RepID=A0ABN2XK77_9ACTN